MASNLTRQILDQHRAPRVVAEHLGNGERAVVPDHVLLDSVPGRVALSAFLSSGRRSRIAVTLACLVEGATGARADFGSVAEAARRAGCHVASPGTLECDSLYRDRLAAPGRVAACAGEGAPSAGALGTLALSVDGLEAAAILAGAPAYLADPPVFGIRLEGGLAPGVSGSDVALAVAARVARRTPPPVFEFLGRGVSVLSTTDRIAIATQAGSLGAAAVLFPSDERTRGFLASQRREADWKPLEAPSGAEYDAELGIDVDTIEPLIAAEEDVAGARPVRHAMGMAVARVVIGSRATPTDLARLAARLAGRRVHPTTELSIVLQGPRVRSLAESAGWLAIFTDAGARLLETGLPPDAGSASSPVGAGLCAASRGEHRAGHRTAWYVASLESCAAAALAGCVVDPREIEAPARAEEYPEMSLEARWLEPAPDLDSPKDELGAARDWIGVPLLGPMRGAVLIQARDRVRAVEILPLGARQETLLGDVESLREFAFAPVDPGFAERARRHGGGFVCAGREFGAGEPAELAAVVLRALGVGAVLARSFAPGFGERLTNAGVLPVEFRHDADASEVAAGHELEFPGLPGALEVGKPLVARNLTRGSQYTLAHRLDARAVSLLREGGLLAASLDAAAAPRRGRA